VLNLTAPGRQDDREEPEGRIAPIRGGDPTFTSWPDRESRQHDTLAASCGKRHVNRRHRAECSADLVLNKLGIP
jgi:hypothetical protein